MQQQYHQFAQGQNSRGEGFGRLCHSRGRRDIDDMPSWRCRNNEKNAYRHQIQVGPRNLRTPSDWLYIHSSLRILVLRYTIHKFRRDFLVFCNTILKFWVCFLVFCYTIHKFWLEILVFCYTILKKWGRFMSCYTHFSLEKVVKQSQSLVFSHSHFFFLFIGEVVYTTEVKYAMYHYAE